MEVEVDIEIEARIEIVLVAPKIDWVSLVAFPLVERGHLWEQLCHSGNYINN